MKSYHEFRPTILFLIKFVGIYLVGNILYGLFITSYHPRPDPVTHEITLQTALALKLCGWEVTISDHPKSPTTAMRYQGDSILAVYEGCNGLNTMIIFVAFVIAFGPLNRSTVWFIPMGLIIIHLMNVLRIGLLFFVSKDLPGYLYFTHKYLFTAFLYMVIFLLWVWWVRKVSMQKK